MGHVGVEAVRVVDGVRVRWRYNRAGGISYRCDDHGAMPLASCPHALATAVLLAREVLGVDATTQPPKEPNHE